jgi:hypothetical protein
MASVQSTHIMVGWRIERVVWGSRCGVMYRICLGTEDTTRIWVRTIRTGHVPNTVTASASLLRYCDITKWGELATGIASRKVNILRRSVHMQFRDYVNWHPPQNFALPVHHLMTLSVSKLYRFSDSESWNPKMLLWFLRDSKPRMSLLAEPSTNLPDQLRPCSNVWQDE